MVPHPLFFFSRTVMVTSLALVIALLYPTVAVTLPSYVDDGSTSEIVNCDTGTELAAPGVYLQSFSGETDVTGGIAGTPPRASIEVVPGERASTCVGFINRTGDTVRMHLEPIDVAAGRVGGSPIKLEADSPFGVSDWLQVPATDQVRVDHGQVLWVAMDADVPSDATAGSYYSAIQGNVIVDDAGGTSISSSVGVQVFFTIPGGAAASGKVSDARAPRVIWWDGLEVGKLPVLEKLRGLGVGTVRFSWQNTGDYTDEINGRVVIESALSGKDVAQLQVDEVIVLRQSERELKATWSDDIPILGRFTPTIEMRGLDGKVDTVELDPIWVIPSWTYLVALFVAIGVPLWWRRRSKRKYAELLERVEAAEARSDQGASEDWDDTSDEWR